MWQLILKNNLRRVYRLVMKPYRFWRQKRFPVSAISDWCDQHHLPISSLALTKQVVFNHPAIVSVDAYHQPFATVTASLPLVYLATLKNVIVIEGSDMVITENGTALYDEVAQDTQGKYGLRSNKARLIVSRELSPLKLGLIFSVAKNEKIPKAAIHFCKDYSFNYYHWLFEALPRLMIIDQFPELDHLPLLVDNLLPQQLSALQLLNKKNREIILLEQGAAHPIETLYYPSALSHAHDNYSPEINYAADFAISPSAIQYLRENLISPLRIKRKIFVSRALLGTNKRLLNDEEIGRALLAKGFEVVHPEKLSFAEQVALFSEASVIVGASGAALANMVFAPAGCEVYVLSANNDRMNVGIFASIAASAQLHLHYVLGQDQIVNPYSTAHNSFTVDVELLLQAL